MTTQNQGSESKSEDKEKRKKKSRRVIAALLRRVEQVCGPIERVDRFADEIADIVEDIRNFLQDEELGGLIPQNERSRLLAATRQFEGIHTHVNRAADICKDLQDALKLADKALSASLLSSIPVGLATTVVVIAVAAIAGVLIWQNAISNDGSTEVEGGQLDVSFDSDIETLFSYREPRCATLFWDAEGAQAVFLDGVEVNAAGSRQVCPDDMTSYALTVEDSLGNTQQSGHEVIVLHDTGDPSVNLRVTPENPTPNEQIQVTVDVSDAESGVAFVEIYSQGELIERCAGTLCRAVLGPFQSGEVTIQAIAFDESGNEGSEETVVLVERGADLPPRVEILRPPGDSTRTNLEFQYDGFDDSAEMWFKDVGLAARVTDPEDGTLDRRALVWTTNRTDLQDELLGFGNSIRARLFSDNCPGTLHEITLTATDSNGNSVAAIRRLLIWTVC